MKQPLDFIDPAASDDELVSISQGHLRDWHDRMQSLRWTISIVRTDLISALTMLDRDLAKLDELTTD